MEYEVELFGSTYHLPTYSISIAEKLEKVEEGNRSTIDFKSKCKNMYNICSELLGSDSVTKAIGTLKECDPNMLNIMYLEICATYNEPLDTYNTDGLDDVLNNAQFSKLLDLGKLAEKAKILR